MSDRIFYLCMPEQDLRGTKIADRFVNDWNLGSRTFRTIRMSCATPETGRTIAEGSRQSLGSLYQIMEQNLQQTAC
jgi:hypothetical protein